ncbi:hypothetical protein EV207_15717 [Scopulibacillus darangshiensis]|uniref:Uncharacterized protein n=1 Tax=Scopulibacillus darangshiensis TaxID=442528 RepID=A0A4R2NF81_9BACL|nr:hypothetical protein EV207_15717 [Scopulibacillus darangshiensis]
MNISLQQKLLNIFRETRNYYFISLQQSKKSLIGVTFQGSMNFKSLHHNYLLLL